MCVTVLVEGASDAAALHALAARRGRDLGAEGVRVVALGGITNIRSVATRLREAGTPLAGLYDAPEVDVVRRGLHRAGVIAADSAGLDEAGFFCCDRDLEDELVRALGVTGAEEVVAAAGEARSLELLTQMPAQRGWTREQLLRRFLTSQSGRKERYARRMVDALPAGREPAPLRRLLDHVG